MNMLTMLSSVSSLSVLAGVQHVIIRDDENNGYDDSDFYYVGVNVVTGEYFKHYHSSTRHGGYNELLNSVMISVLAQNVQAEVQAMFAKACIAKATEIMNNDYSYVISTGDTVQVTNTRARKHKGEVFTVTDKSTYHDTYGRVQTTYLHGGDVIKTANTNCTRTVLGDAIINTVAERLALGLAVKF